MTEERQKLIEASILINEVIESVKLKQPRHLNSMLDRLEQAKFGINRVVIFI